MTSRRPDLTTALAALSPDVATAVREASRFLTERGIRERGFDVALYDSLVEKAKVG